MTLTSSITRPSTSSFVSILILTLVHDIDLVVCISNDLGNNFDLVVCIKIDLDNRTWPWHCRLYQLLTLTIVFDFDLVVCITIDRGNRPWPWPCRLYKNWPSQSPMNLTFYRYWPWLSSMTLTSYRFIEGRPSVWTSVFSCWRRLTTTRRRRRRPSAWSPRPAGAPLLEMTSSGAAT